MTTLRIDDEYGPPTLEDDLWFHEHVRAAEYPKVKRGDKPMEGQRTLMDALEDERRLAHVSHEEMSVLDALSDPWGADDWTDVKRELERLDADEQRAREDEAQQFRDHRPE